MEARRRTWGWALSQCFPFQEEAGAVVKGTSEDRRASEPPVGERTGPAPSSLAQEEAKWTTGEAHLAPCSTQGPLAQKAPCAEACLGGDAGSGLRPRAEVWSWGHTLCHLRELGLASLLPVRQNLVTLSAGSLLWSALCLSLLVHLP